MNIPTFKRELEFVTGCMGTKSTIPIMSNVMIDVKKRICTLTGTDLEVAAVSAFSMPSEKAWKGTVPARPLLKILKSLKGVDEAPFTWDKDFKLSIKAGSFESSLDGMSTDSFPELPPAPDERISFPLPSLAAMFAAVKHAISSEESRFTLNAGLLDLSKSGLRVVATDGYRLALASMPWPGADVTLRCLFHKATLVHFANLRGGTVDFAQNTDRHYFFAKDGKVARLLMERKLTGSFPDYERVIPKEFKIHVTVKREALLHAIKQVKPYADERSLAGRFLFESTLAKSGITVNAETSDRGKGSASLAAGFQDLCRLEIGLSLDYMEQALTAFKSDDVEILANDPNSQIMIKGTIAEGISMQEVLMPLRI